MRLFGMLTNVQYATAVEFYSTSNSSRHNQNICTVAGATSRIHRGYNDDTRENAWLVALARELHACHATKSAHKPNIHWAN